MFFCAECGEVLDLQRDTKNAHDAESYEFLGWSIKCPNCGAESPKVVEGNWGLHDLDTGDTLCGNCTGFSFREACKRTLDDWSLIVLSPSLRLSDPQCFPFGEWYVNCDLEILPPIEKD